MYAGNSRTSLAFSITPWVKRLLIANAVVFFITMVNQEFFVRWFAFAPSAVLTRPWGALTYMFLHGDLMHLFLNMLVLFFFGPPLEARWGSTDFIKFYVVCGLGGVALSFIFTDAWIVGASAAIYGLMLAFAMLWPNAPIYIWGIFPVKAWLLVAVLFVASLMSAFGGGGGNIAHLAHLGGIITGFLYLKSGWRPGEVKRPKRGGVRVKRMAIVHREEKAGEARSETDQAERWTVQDEAILDEVDRILDKISAEGMSSLTSKERATLDHVSRRHRSN